MTTICVKNGSIYADRKILVPASPTAMTIHKLGTKLFRSKCNQFAYAVTGTLYTGDNRVSVEQSIREWLETPNGDRNDFDRLLPHRKDVLMVLTRDRAYVTRKMSLDVTEPDTFLAIGSGEDEITTCYYHITNNPKKMFELTARVEGHTSAEFDRIDRMTLDPIGGETC